MSVVLTFTYALERRNNELGAGCLIDKQVFNDVVQSFQLRELRAMHMQKRGNKPTEVHQLVAKKEAAGEDEWMYQLEEQNSAVNEFTHWKKAYDAIKEQRWEDATASLDTALST
eukprot:gene4221-2063_t